MSYVRHVLRGRFEGCRIQATRDEMARLLDEARTQAKDYYERLLIEDLTAQLAASQAGATPSNSSAKGES